MSSIFPLFNILDMLVPNTANADVTMSTNFVTFISFFWYFLVSTVAMPLMLTPVRETAPSGMLTGRPKKVLNVSKLDIPLATLRLLEQALSHINRSNILGAFYTFLPVLTTLVIFFKLHLLSRIVGPRELKALLV